MANIASQFFAKLEAAGLTREQAMKVIESQDNALAEQIVALIQDPRSEYPYFGVAIDYDQPVEWLIDDCKLYWTDPDIRFVPPQNKKGRSNIEIYLVGIGRGSSEKAIKRMNAQGLRPATLEEVLTLSIAYPDIQQYYPTAALGSLWRNQHGKAYVPALMGSGPNCELHLISNEEVWGMYWRFAAVLK